MSIFVHPQAESGWAAAVGFLRGPVWSGATEAGRASNGSGRPTLLHLPCEWCASAPGNPSFTGVLGWFGGFEFKFEFEFGKEWHAFKVSCTARKPAQGAYLGESNKKLWVLYSKFAVVQQKQGFLGKPQLESHLGCCVC